MQSDRRIANCLFVFTCWQYSFLQLSRLWLRDSIHCVTHAEGVFDRQDRALNRQPQKQAQFRFARKLAPGETAFKGIFSYSNLRLVSFATPALLFPQAACSFAPNPPHLRGVAKA